MKRSIKRRITFNWQEGVYLDLWMFVHLLGGVTLGFLSLYLGLGWWESLVGILVIAVGHEIWEHQSDICEHAHNKVADVIVVLGGAIIARFLTPSDESVISALLIYSAAVFITLSVYGWLAYRERAGSRLRK